LRHILHADLDAFYAAVEQLDNPTLRDKQVLVVIKGLRQGCAVTLDSLARTLASLKFAGSDTRSARQLMPLQRRSSQSVEGWRTCSSGRD
jgi:nucleotidyltransferase/DNA polymerase involved in DNA repair